MPSLNVQSDLRRRLSVALAPVEVRVKVPESRPSKLVTVSREGGARKNALLDGAGIGIYCWAPSEQEAWELADKATDAMAALPFSGGYAKIDMEAMYSDPDPDTGCPRWYLSYTITTFIPKE